MTIVPAGVKVHLALATTDMRQHMDGLAMLFQRRRKLNSPGYPALALWRSNPRRALALGSMTLLARGQIELDTDPLERATIGRHLLRNVQPSVSSMTSEDANNRATPPRTRYHRRIKRRPRLPNIHIRQCHRNSSPYRFEDNLPCKEPSTHSHHSLVGSEL